MEIIRITEGKLKLTLTAGEMQKYGVSSALVKEDPAAARRALMPLFERLKGETGFDARGEKTLIEAFGDKRGGCELFVTLLPQKRRLHTACDRFPSLATARRAVTGLSLSREEDGGASLYALGEGEVLLVLPVGEGEGVRTFTPRTLLEEYGEREKSPLFHAYAKEYGTCLYGERAVSRLKESARDAFSL